MRNKDSYRTHNVSWWVDHYNPFHTENNAKAIRYHITSPYRSSVYGNLHERINWRGEYWWKYTHDNNGNRL